MHNFGMVCAVENSKCAIKQKKISFNRMRTIAHFVVSDRYQSIVAGYQLA